MTKGGIMNALVRVVLAVPLAAAIGVSGAPALASASHIQMVDTQVREGQAEPRTINGDYDCMGNAFDQAEFRRGPVAVRVAQYTSLKIFFWKESGRPVQNGEKCLGVDLNSPTVKFGVGGNFVMWLPQTVNGKKQAKPKVVSRASVFNLSSKARVEKSGTSTTRYSVSVTGSPQSAVSASGNATRTEETTWRAGGERISIRRTQPTECSISSKDGMWHIVCKLSLPDSSKVFAFQAPPNAIDAGIVDATVQFLGRVTYAGQTIDVPAFGGSTTVTAAPCNWVDQQIGWC